jgi:NitT/TauT family transport system substrate-binding protein
VADAGIAGDRRGAAEAFVWVSGVRMGVEQIDPMLADPETRFTTAPKGAMAYADFLAAAGLIKVRAATWTDLFVPQLHGRVGS